MAQWHNIQPAYTYIMYMYIYMYIYVIVAPVQVTWTEKMQWLRLLWQFMLVLLVERLRIPTLITWGVCVCVCVYIDTRTHTHTAEHTQCNTSSMHSINNIHTHTHSQTHTRVTCNTSSMHSTLRVVSSVTYVPPFGSFLTSSFLRSPFKSCDSTRSLICSL